jgi:hypothetical protein
MIHANKLSLVNAAEWYLVFQLAVLRGRTQAPNCLK